MRHTLFPQRQFDVKCYQVDCPTAPKNIQTQPKTRRSCIQIMYRTLFEKRVGRFKSPLTAFKSSLYADYKDDIKCQKKVPK